MTQATAPVRVVVASDRLPWSYLGVETMNVIWLLAVFTIVVVLCFAVYAFVSHRRLEKHGGQAKGIGGVNDPLSGARPLDRSPREMTESLKDKNR